MEAVAARRLGEDADEAYWLDAFASFGFGIVGYEAS